jgi:hypothetical protein
MLVFLLEVLLKHNAGSSVRDPARTKKLVFLLEVLLKLNAGFSVRDPARTKIGLKIKELRDYFSKLIQHRQMERYCDMRFLAVFIF